MLVAMFKFVMGDRVWLCMINLCNVLCPGRRTQTRFGLRFTTISFFLFLFAVCSDIQSRIKSLKTLVSVLCGMYASFTDCDSVQGQIQRPLQWGSSTCIVKMNS